MNMGNGIRRGKLAGAALIAGSRRSRSRPPLEGLTVGRHGRSGGPPGRREQRLHDRHQLRPRGRGRQGPGRSAFRPDRSATRRPPRSAPRLSWTGRTRSRRLPRDHAGGDGRRQRHDRGPATRPSDHARRQREALQLHPEAGRARPLRHRPPAGEPGRARDHASAGPGDPAVGRQAQDERLRPGHDHQRHPEHHPDASPRRSIRFRPTSTPRRSRCSGRRRGPARASAATRPSARRRRSPSRRPRTPARRARGDRAALHPHQLRGRPVLARVLGEDRRAGLHRRRPPSRRSRPRSSRRPTRLGSRTRSCSCRA